MLPYTTVTPKDTSVTQQHGLIEGKKVLEAVIEKENEKQEKDEKKHENKEKRKIIKEKFIKRKDQYQFKGKCSISGYKQCSICNDVLKSICTKQSCKVDDIKPKMIEATKPTSKREIINVNEEESSDLFTLSEFF